MTILDKKICNFLLLTSKKIKFLDQFCRNLTISFMAIKRFNFCLILIRVYLYFSAFTNLWSEAQFTGGLQNSGWPKVEIAGIGWFRFQNLNQSITFETDLNKLQPTASFKNDTVELTGGWRDLPSSTLFYSDPKFPASFLPPKRRSSLFFFRLFPKWFVPGVWSSKELAGAGIYLATDTFFLAFQPKLKIWGFTIKENHILIDAEGERKNYQGYARFRSWSTDQEKKSRSLIIEAERRPYWDRFKYREELTEKPSVLDSKFLENSSSNQSVPNKEKLQFEEVAKRERQYRSGLILVDSRFESLYFMLAGMDHGDVGFRLSRLRRNTLNLGTGWYFLPELSYYQTQIYKEDLILREMRLGVGLANHNQRGSFEAIVKFSDNESISIELNGSFRSNKEEVWLSNLWIQPLFVFTYANHIDHFEYMGLIESSDGQSRFIERAKFAFGLRAYSENFRVVFFYYGKESDTSTIKDWGYLRLEFQQRF